jgi:hypothetical protein
MRAIVVERRFLFAGRAAAGSVFARTACKKTCGECHVMQSPGHVRIAAGKMALATSNIFFIRRRKKL